jgi:hypothetical protein
MINGQVHTTDEDATVGGSPEGGPPTDLLGRVQAEEVRG